MRVPILLHIFLALWIRTSVGQTILKYYGVDDIEPSQFSFLKDSLSGNFALVELQSDTLTWKNALDAAEKNQLKIIIWPLGHGHQYTPWAWNGSSWDITEGMSVLKLAERYVASGGKALLAVLMSHEPYYNGGNPFTADQMTALNAVLKSVAPHVKLFVYMNDMAYYDKRLAPFYPYRIDDGIMDIAGIYKHHFGTKHTLEETLKEIDDDYDLIQKKGLHMQLFFALQSFATDGIEYRMPSAAEMLEYGATVINKRKLDGVFWYPWGRVSTSYSSWLGKDRYDSLGGDRWSVVTRLSSYLTTTHITKREMQPAHFSLSQNFPNPFNPKTTIQFSVPKAGLYSLEVFNLLGQKVADLFNKEISPGNYTVNFDPGGLPSGIYFYTLKGSSATISRKMALLK